TGNSAVPAGRRDAFAGALRECDTSASAPACAAGTFRDGQAPWSITGDESSWESLPHLNRSVAGEAGFYQIEEMRKDQPGRRGRPSRVSRTPNDEHVQERWSVLTRRWLFPTATSRWSSPGRTRGQADSEITGAGPAVPALPAAAGSFSAAFPQCRRKRSTRCRPGSW